MDECEHCGRPIELRTQIDMHGQEADRWLPYHGGESIDCPVNANRYCTPA